MRKPEQLRAWLIGAIPELARDPDKLSIFADKGRVAARATVPLAYEYRYTLNVFLLDFVGHPDALIVPLIDWLRANQPERLVNFETGNEAISFEAAFLDTRAVDLAITLELTEAVSVVPRPDGGYDVTHWEEPNTAALLDGALSRPPAPLKSVWIDGETQALIS